MKKIAKIRQFWYFPHSKCNKQWTSRCLGHINDFVIFFKCLRYCRASYMILLLKTSQRTIDMVAYDRYVVYEDWPQICGTLHQFIHLYAMCASNAHSFLRIVQTFFFLLNFVVILDAMRTTRSVDLERIAKGTDSWWLGGFHF